MKEPGVIEKGLNEFIYSLILNMPVSQLRVLPEYLRKKIGSPKRAAKFAYHSSTDEKRDLLSYLDITFFWTFASIEKLTSKNYFSILKDFQSKSTLEAMRRLIEGNIYVTSDKNHLLSLGRVAQNTRTGVYTKNIELLTLGNYIKDWPKKMINHDQKEADEALDAVEKINRLLYNSIKKYKKSEYLFGVTSDELDMLFVFEKFKNSYVSHDNISKMLSGDMKAHKIASVESTLLEKMLIQRHLDWSKRQYTITKMGIRVINEFRESTLKAA